MNWRQLRHVIRWLVYLPLALLLVAALTLSTSPGAYLLISLLDRLLPMVEMAYQGGQLNHRLSLSYFRLTLDDMSIDADNLEVSWRPACTLLNRLCVDALQVARLDLQIHIPVENGMVGDDGIADSDSSPGLGLPFTIIIADGQVDDGHLSVAGETIEWQQGRLAVVLDDSGIDVQRASFARVAVLLAATDEDGALTLAQRPADDAGVTEMTAADHANRHGDAVAGVQPADTAPLLPWLPFDLAALALPFNLQLSDIVVGQFELAEAVPASAPPSSPSTATPVAKRWQQQLQHVALAGNWNGTRLDLQQLAVSHGVYGDLTAHGTLALARPFPLQLALQLQPSRIDNYSALQGSDWSLQLGGDLQHLQLNARERHQLQWSLDGELALLDPQLPFQLNFAAPTMLWPDDLQKSFEYRQLSGNVAGDIAAQQFALSAELEAVLEGHPLTTQLELQGSHAGRQLDITQFSARHLQQTGRLTGSGRFSYGPRLSWMVESQMENLQLPAFEQFSGAELSGEMSVQGYAEGEAWQVSLSRLQLQGTYLELPLHISGGLSFNDQWVGKAERLVLELADSCVALNGDVDQQWQLQGQVHLRHPERWLPEWHGAMAVEFSLLGDRLAPVLKVTASATDIEYDHSLAIDTAQLALSSTPSADYAHQLKLQIPSLRWGEQRVTDIQLQLAGDRQRHQLHLQSGGTLASALTLHGSLDADLGHWQGVIEQAELATGEGQWRLAEPTAISADLAAAQLHLAVHCWQTQNSRICLTDEAVVGRSGELELALHLAVADFTGNLLQEDFSANGSLNGSLNATWAPRQVPSVKLRLRSTDMIFSFPDLLNDSRETIKTTELSVDGLSDARQGQFSFVLKTERGTQLRLQLASEFAQRSLNGVATISKLQLGHFRSLLVDVEQLSGLVSGELLISGSLEKPLLSGNMGMTDGSLLLFANPTAVTEMSLQAQLQGQQAQLSSQFKIGQGSGELHAQADWRETLELSASLHGDKLQLLLPPDSDLRVSPHLDLRWHAAKLVLSGEVEVPQANLVYRSLPAGTVDISDDLVFIDRASEQPHQQMDYQLRLQLRLGQQVNVDLLGLVGSLGGQLDVRQARDIPLQIYGPLLLTRGQYRAYGQKLLIQPEAAINFNGPVGRGNLNIKAAREIKSDNVLAGLHATGTIDQPVVTLYSDPTLEQQEILSYITRGRGLDADQNNQAMGAATSLGVAAISSTGITEAVEQLSGVSQLELATDGQGDDTQVTIGGYAGEHLYVKYGVGVFLPINELTLRLYLLNQLWLETVSGLEHSIDLYYSFVID